MVKHSPHRRWKGHDMMCTPQKIKGAGQAAKTPMSALRRLGRRRRLRRGYLGDQD